MSYDGKHDFALNCVLFYTLLSNEPLYKLYVELGNQDIVRLVNVLDTLKSVEIPDDTNLDKQTILRVNLTHNICTLLRQMMSKNHNIISTHLLP